MATRKIKEILRINEENLNFFNMAMQSANLIRWRYSVAEGKAQVEFNNMKGLELNRQDMANSIHPQDKKLFNENLDAVISGKAIRPFAVKIFMGTYKEYRICNISTMIQEDKLGKVEFIYGIIEDMTHLSIQYQKIKSLRDSLNMALDAGGMSAWKYDRVTNRFVILHGEPLLSPNVSLDDLHAYIHPEEEQLLSNAIELVYARKTDRVSLNLRLNTNGVEYR